MRFGDEQLVSASYARNLPWLVLVRRHLMIPLTPSTEMRHDVTTPVYRLLKTIDTFLASFTPPVSFQSSVGKLSKVPYPSKAARGWIPLYTMVTFRPDVSYALAQQRAAWQMRMIRIAGWTFLGALGSILAMYYRRPFTGRFGR